MRGGGGLWRDGRRAWQRLDGWHHDGPSAQRGHPDDGDAAVAALVDIGLLRHLLGQAELVAVRTARRHARSWAEIATTLGITRQSAWERWRDLDDVAAGLVGVPRDSQAGGPAGSGGTVVDLSHGPAAPSPGGATAHVHATGWTRGSQPGHRPTRFLVPDVVDLDLEVALEVLRMDTLVGVAADPDGPPLPVVGGHEWLVTGQRPQAGVTVPADSPVALSVERRGGSAGVREPRRPGPSPRSAQESRREP